MKTSIRIFGITLFALVGLSCGDDSTAPFLPWDASDVDVRDAELDGDRTPNDASANVDASEVDPPGGADSWPREETRYHCSALVHCQFERHQGDTTQTGFDPVCERLVEDEVLSELEILNVGRRNGGLAPCHRLAVIDIEEALVCMYGDGLWGGVCSPEIAPDPGFQSCDDLPTLGGPGFQYGGGGCTIAGFPGMACVAGASRRACIPRRCESPCRIYETCERTTDGLGACVPLSRTDECPELPEDDSVGAACVDDSECGEASDCIIYRTEQAPGVCRRQCSGFCLDSEEHACPTGFSCAFAGTCTPNEDIGTLD